MRRILLLCLLACAAPASADPLAGPALAKALKDGGFVLYMRHPESDQSQKDDPLIDFANCATQRNLSEAGRRTATDIGQQMRAVGLKFDRVVTSEYCRARDAARLLGVADAAADGALNDGGKMEVSGPDSPQAKALRAMLGTAPGAGANTLIIAHRPNIVDAAGPGFANTAEGEVAVFRPIAETPGFTLMARLRPADWAGLTATAKQ